MSTHLKYACFVLFLLLFLSCSGGSSVKIKNQQATEQPQAEAIIDPTIDSLYINQQQHSVGKDLSEENTFIPRFAMVDTTGERLIYTSKNLDDVIDIDETMAKRYTHCIYEGSIFPIKFEKRQKAATEWIMRDFNEEFNNICGFVFTITEGCILSVREKVMRSEYKNAWVFCDALLVDENYLNDLEILPIIEEYEDKSFEYDDDALIKIVKYDPPPTHITNYYKTQFDREVVGTFTLARTENIVFYKVIYEVLSHGDTGYPLLVAALAIADGERVLGSDDNKVEPYYIHSIMKKSGKHHIITWESTIDGSNCLILEERENRLTPNYDNVKYKTTHPLW